MRIAAISHLFNNGKKVVAINTILIANAFIGYSYAFKFLTNSTSLEILGTQFLSIIAVHFLVLFLALLLGEYFSRKTKNSLTFLILWMLSGALLSLVPLITGLSYLGIIVFAVITGANFGFGLPACLGYFASTTESTNRGKLGGIIYFLIGIGAFMISTVGTESLVVVTLVLAGWKAVGLLLIVLLKPIKTNFPTKPSFSYHKIFSNRGFLFYFVPWAMFVFVNSLAFPVIEKVFPADLVQSSANIEYVLSGFSAVIFGFFADSKGRKRLTVAGFAFLGIGYGVLGFSAGNIFGWWFYTVIDGIAWGCFVMIFIFALWGDLSEGRNGGKIYAIGVMPYLFSSFMRFSIGSTLGDAINNYSTIFSFASFFLFMAVLPLVFAPETMSEQIIKNNDLKNYVDKAKKQVLKVREKNQKNIEHQELPEKSEEYEKARELAEKYY
jgi:MFS family permease